MDGGGVAASEGAGRVGRVADTASRSRLSFWARRAANAWADGTARAEGVVKRRLLWIAAGAAATAAAVLVYGCVVGHSCQDDGTCSGEGAGGDTGVAVGDTGAGGDAGALGGDARAGGDTGAAVADADASGDTGVAVGDAGAAGDGALDSALADASSTDGAFEGVPTDAAQEACDESCGIDAASDALADSSAAEGAADAGDGSTLAGDGGLAGALLGTWTLTGTQTFVCPEAGALSADASAGAVTERVTFSTGAGTTDAGQVGLLYDAGEECALVLVVDSSVATLVYEPQKCDLDDKGIDWTFTSVQVSASMGSLGITETYTDHAGCRYEIQGMLTRPDGG